MKAIYSGIIILLAIGCGKSESEKLEEENRKLKAELENKKLKAQLEVDNEKLKAELREQEALGQYKLKEVEGDDTVIIKLKENGVCEAIENDQSPEEGRWEFIGEEIHMIWGSQVIVLEVNEDKTVEIKAYITNGERVTFKPKDRMVGKKTK